MTKRIEEIKKRLEAAPTNDDAFLAIFANATSNIAHLIEVCEVYREALKRMDCDCAGEGVLICIRCEALAKAETL